MSSSDWESGYSILLQSIENQIAATAPGSEFLSPSLTDASASGHKRSRVEPLGVSAGSPTTDFGQELSSGKKMKALAEMDELRLNCEQLRDRLKQQELNEQSNRDELIRQIQFLKSQNDTLKNESQLRLDKYYEEKKKWQVKLREVEGKLKERKVSASAVLPHARDQNVEKVTVRASPTTSDSDITRKILELEDNLAGTVEESKQLRHENLDLKQQLFKAEQELLQFRDSSKLQGESIQEARALRGQCTQLETTLKHITREQEQTKKKLKNQTMLEEELSSCQTKLRIAQETINAQKRMQEEYQQMKEERKMWNEMFQSIMEKTVSMDRTEASALTDGSLEQSTQFVTKTVSPTQVLQQLSASQSRCALLLQGQGQLQQGLSEIRRQLRLSQEIKQETNQKLIKVQTELESTERALHSATEQKKLFQGEIASLRALLETFDVEFRIGKPEIGQLYAAKDSLINDLRKELDFARELALSKSNELKEAISKLEASASTLQTLNSALTESKQKMNQIAESHEDKIESDAVAEGSANMEEWKDKADALSEMLESANTDLKMLQEYTGIDYIPQKTRVLHFINNPSAVVKSSTDSISVPSVQKIQELQREINAIRNAREEGDNCDKGPNVVSSNDSSSNSEDAVNQSMNVSVIGGEQISRVLDPPPPVGSAAAGTATAAPDSIKLNQRLKEMFKERITSFREGVYLLTGFKIDLYSADAGAGQHLPRLRLRSMYAESPDDCLLFQLRGDAPELLETDFASKLDPEAMKYLTAYNSVPAFLSHVTMQLFENQTFMG